MNKAYLIALGTLALAATGCTGGFEHGTDISDPGGVDAGTTVTPPVGDEGTAQALFDANVRAGITATCGTSGCHMTQDPAFVAADPVNAYQTITIHRDRLYPGYESVGSKILSNGTGAHYGAVLTPGDVGAIQAWLSQEKLSSTGDNAPVSALAVWSGCMEYIDWDGEGVANRWAQKPTGNQGDCEACHNLGADGFFASQESLRVFQTITEQPAFMPSYFTLDATGQNVVINRARLEAVGSQIAPHEAHGDFLVDDPENDAGAMLALQRFYDTTKARLDAGACGPRRFK